MTRRPSFASKLSIENPSAAAAVTSADPDEFIGSQAHIQLLADIAELRYSILSPKRKRQKLQSTMIEVALQEKVDGPVVFELMDIHAPLSVGLQRRLKGTVEKWRVYDGNSFDPSKSKPLDISRSLSDYDLTRSPQLIALYEKNPSAPIARASEGKRFISITVQVNGGIEELEMHASDTAERILRVIDLSPSKARLQSHNGRAIALDSTLADLRISSGDTFKIKYI